MTHEPVKYRCARDNDLIRRGDALNAVRDACINKHLPFNSATPEGRRTLEALEAIRTTKKAAAQLAPEEDTRMKCSHGGEDD